MSAMRDRSVVRSSVSPSAKYCCSGSLPRLANGSTTIDSRGAVTGGEPETVDDTLAVGKPPTKPSRVPRIDPNRPGNILDALLSQILERVGQLVADLVAY